jgi:hypothetical protein
MLYTELGLYVGRKKKSRADKHNNGKCSFFAIMVKLSLKLSTFSLSEVALQKASQLVSGEGRYQFVPSLLNASPRPSLLFLLSVGSHYSDAPSL